MLAWNPPSSAAGPVAYLILAHRRGDQVRRLASRITQLSPDARVLIHWDASAPEPCPVSLPDRVWLTQRRIPAGWGDWSLVEAFLILLDQANRWFAPRWSVLISGEDWPVRNLSCWEAHLDVQGIDALIQSAVVRNWPKEGEIDVALEADEIRRYGDSWIRLARPSWPLAARLCDGLVRRLEARASRGSRYPAVMNLYGRAYAISWRPHRLPSDDWALHKGAQWMVCGPRAAQILLSTPNAIRKHFQHTLIPDESFPHTVLRNTEGLLVGDGLTSYAPWSHFGRLPHLVLRSEDLPEIVASGAPFARKIGEGEHVAIVDELDSLVEAECARAATQKVNSREQE